MHFFDLLEKRHCVRSFQGKAVEAEKLQRILNAVSTAPSAGNLKAYSVTVVKDAKEKRLLADAAFGQGFVADAPLVLVFSADAGKNSARYGKRGELFALQDATIACAFAHLAAVELGLGSVWCGAFEEKDVAKAIGLQKGFTPIALLPIGYAAK